MDIDGPHCRDGIEHQLAVIIEGHGRAGQYVLRLEELIVVANLAIGLGEHIFDGELPAIAQLGQGIAQLIQDGDAGIAVVVIAPDQAHHGLEHGNGIAFELLGIKSQRQGGISDVARLIRCRCCCSRFISCRRKRGIRNPRSGFGGGHISHAQPPRIQS